MMRKSCFLLLFLLFSISLVAREQHSPAFQIIYLNGPSSAGKSTLSEALQDTLEDPFLHIGIDKIIELMPKKLNNWEGGYAPQGFSWASCNDSSGHLVQQIRIGPFAEKIIQTLKEEVVTLAKMGHFIIIDDIALGAPAVDLWREALKDYKVLWIGIKVPLEVLEQREIARGNRLQGQARGLFSQVHQGVSYDLEFDTSKEPLETIVGTIQQRIYPSL
jgi:chloramphenicol 3-O phosphotransferase